MAERKEKDLIDKIGRCTHPEQVDWLLEGESRKTVLKAAEEKKAALNRHLDEVVDVEALISGEHALTGLGLLKGKHYRMKRRHAGKSVVKEIKPPTAAPPPPGTKQYKPVPAKGAKGGDR
jgi:hypothetical protein